MRRLILLAALATLPASVASAQPPPYREPYREPYRAPDRGPYCECDCSRYSYNEGYYDREGRRTRRVEGRRRWTPIAEQTSATSERQFHNVLGRGGSYRRLLVESVRGAPVIERVAVEFTDRQTQVWDLNRRLPRGADEVINLGGPKRIHRIIVYTNPSYGGTYSIYGA